MALLRDRVLSQTAIREDGCIEWTGPKSRNGYGNVRLSGSGRNRRGSTAHRAVYELLVGPISKGLVLDHLCRNRWCVSPSHLEPVTQHENIKRAAAVKTHCPHGHEYTDTNTRVYGGSRRCRECGRMACRKRYQARKVGC